MNCQAVYKSQPKKQVKPKVKAKSASIKHEVANRSQPIKDSKAKKNSKPIIHVKPDNNANQDKAIKPGKRASPHLVTNQTKMPAIRSK